MSALRLEVEFLTGRYAAADPFRRHLPEWPPAPARVFAALACAAFESEDEDALAALRQLEQAQPPVVLASDHSTRWTDDQQCPVHYVPVNDIMFGKESKRTRQPRPFPSVTPDHPVVQFVWRDLELDAAAKSKVAEMAALVPYLGESASPVRVALTEREFCLPAYEPHALGDRSFRAPFPGQLDQFRADFAKGNRRAAGLQYRYRMLSPSAAPPTPTPVGCTYSEFYRFELPTAHGCSLAHTVRLTTAVRAALVIAAGDRLPKALHGHETDGSPLKADHAAIVPLAFVIGHHANGRILGFAVLLPAGLPADERRDCLRAIAALEKIRLPGGAELSVRRVFDDEGRVTLKRQTWTGPARRWCTVTPVVLNRYPGRRADKTLPAVVKSMCRHAGLPEPMDFSFGPNPPAEGIPHARDFVVQRPHWRPKPHGHLLLEFAEPVRGPLIIGCRRHYGLGLMRPLS